MRHLLPLLLVSVLTLSACGGKDKAAAAPGATEAATGESLLPVPAATPTAAMGEQIFKRCAACHTIDKDGRNGIGPNLHGVVGRALASHPDFPYSDALKAKGGVWNEAALDAWLENPMKDIPGARMSFAGIPDKADRDALVLYLKSQSD